MITEAIRPIRPPCAFTTLRGTPQRSQLVKEATHSERGFLHSIHTGSVVDGPGMRTVIWTTGCMLRCQYCHNPDTWHMKRSEEHTSELQSRGHLVCRLL